MSRRILAGMARSAPRFDLARLFAALSDRTRLRLLKLMGESEVCVCFFRRNPEPEPAQGLAASGLPAQCGHRKRAPGREVDALPHPAPVRRRRRRNSRHGPRLAQGRQRDAVRSGETWQSLLRPGSLCSPSRGAGAGPAPCSGHHAVYFASLTSPEAQIPRLND